MNKIKTFLLTILFTATLAMVLVNSTKAADYNITCDANGCTSPGTAVFNQTNVAPGDSFTKTIEVKNLHNETLNLEMNASQNQGTDNIFLNVVDVTVIGLGGRTRFSDTLANFLTTNKIDLGSLNDQGLEQAIITMTLRDVGNEYQGKQAKFNININISVQASGPSIGGTGGGTTPSPSPSPTVGFVAGAFITPTPSPEILGEATPSASTLSDTILGLQSFNWWWPLLAQLVIFSFYYYLKRKSPHTSLYIALLPLFLSLLSQYLHSRLGCPQSSNICPWYWFINLSIFSLTTLIFSKLRLRMVS
ncbi:hypothetical protein ACFL18_00740 [Patescibacteria group bacterium]